jgi:hypothetical protein
MLRRSMLRKRQISSSALALCIAAAAFAVPAASATTFCVPDYSAACPNSGGNVKEADLEKAMGLNSSDGVADEIVIAAGTVIENGSFEPASGFTDPGSIEPAGTDPLNVVGAGTAATIVTSSGNANVYLLDLGSGSRLTTVRNLTLRIPASFPDGLGAAAQLAKGDTLEAVDIVSRNEGSDGVGSAFGAGNVVSGGEIRGEAGGSIDDALRVSSKDSQLLVTDMVLRDVSWGLITGAEGAQLTAHRITQTGTRTYGAIASPGSIVIDNSIFGMDDGIALYASATAPSSSIAADHLTAVNSGGATNPAFELRKTGGAGKVTVTAANSILRGFGSGYDVDAAFGPGIGVATLTVNYSNFQQTGSSTGVLNVATGNIDIDPQLNADRSLPAGSPSIDAGDPGAGGLLTDFLGAPRPNDGNGDCVARRDQGAFELQAPLAPGCQPPGGEQPGGGQPGGGSGGASQSGGSGGGPGADSSKDTRAPETSIAKGPGAKLSVGKAKFTLAADEAGIHFECELDGGKRLACPSPKRYANLAPGRHTFKAWAIDAAGNRDATPAKRRFRVPA